MNVEKGSCHCGAVRFEVDIDLSTGGARCNCSICTKTMRTGQILKPSAFRLLAGEDHLGSYEFGRKVMQHYFCKTCGIHCFGRGHIEQLGGDFVSINLNCLDAVDVNTLRIGNWDGRHDNWQAKMRAVPWPIFEPATVLPQA